MFYFDGCQARVKITHKLAATRFSDILFSRVLVSGAAKKHTLVNIN